MTTRTMTVFAALAVAGAALSAQAPDAASVLAGVHKALGGADKVAAVKTLTATGTTKRVTPRGTIENALELSLQLPDKFMMRTVVAGEGSMAVYRNTGFNGEGLINELDAPPNLSGPLRERMAAGDRPGGAAGAEPTAEQKAAARLRQITAATREFARLTLGMLGSSYAGFPLQFKYAGEADAADGTARVLDVGGPDGFAARLFVDTKTGLPLMLAWSEPRGPAANAPIVERRIYYADFRKVGGLNLPHTIKRSTDGTLTEETTFTEIAVNSKIDAKKFSVSK